MPTLSVLTLTRNRTGHLKNLLHGLSRSTRTPDECIVVHMNEPAKALGEWPFPCRHYTYNSPDNIALPLPQARNVAARYATSDILLFLDVDCIPAAEMVAAYEQACKQRPDTILMGGVNYLQQTLEINWQEDAVEDFLQANSAPHPKRDVSTIASLTPEPDYGRFWSLSFALTKSLFNQLGGFSECYPSYGAEDTDFAWKARAQGTELLWVPEALSFHQYHVSGVPPWHNFDSIVYNAKVFYQRWNEWPMSSWLSVFAKEGYINWDIKGKELRIIKRPQQANSLTLATTP